MKSAGYLYVLIHPSNPNLYKVGVTIREVNKRLAEHNRKSDEYTGQIVLKTGLKWEIKTYISVPDVYWAELAFWGATPLSSLPFLGGIEIHEMEWGWVQSGLEAAKSAGLRPKPTIPDYVYAYTAWMKKHLYGRGITLDGFVRSRAGKSNFNCISGHSWRISPLLVANGQGCPECGIGEKSQKEMLELVKPAFTCLLTHDDFPGFVKVMSVDDLHEVNINGGWNIHRYRYVDNEPILAENLLLDLLGVQKPYDGGKIKIDIQDAEEAFRQLIYSLRAAIALREQINTMT
ncbi:TPA: GIY-YIG nuclease family protein [Legionella pneumophila]|nr:GIY-YIG nuclease family protein [Legionella pneumophila]HAU0842625.1 GIY-YIG nuclease family protein [Legionella pneumophila]